MSANVGPQRNGANTPGVGLLDSTHTLPDASANITTIGVKRTAFGTSGRVQEIYTNHFKTSIPDGIIYHYDGTSLPHAPVSSAS